MGIKDAAWNAIKWKYMKKRLGYSDEEMIKFRENPKNDALLSRAPELLKITIVAEVIDSHGCNSQHKIGNKFYFDGAGNLLTERCPDKICIYALNAITPQVFTVIELLYADADPNKMKFNRAACFDVGLECGGWGRIVMEIKVENRNKLGDQ
ncbi:MAG: TIGR04076 family protein [candidate division Zixibacteria bacterium]|nr:TIGR04076 family protein [candidate division Zixibacteria bacterium]